MKTGKVKNVAAFGKLVGICNDLGASYNPSKAALTPTALATLLEQAQQSLEAVNVARATYVLAVNARQEKYASIYSLTARVVRALVSSGTSVENIHDARLLKRKLSPKQNVKVPPPGAVNSQDGSVKTSNSSSQLDFDGQADTFAKFIQLIMRIPVYAPNEAELKLESLHTVLVELRTTSQAVAESANALANARIHRNKVLFGKNGMYETGTAVKEYIRSVFGVRSEPARELGKLRLAA
jgi:hypothetical protein